MSWTQVRARPPVRRPAPAPRTIPASTGGWIQQRPPAPSAGGFTQIRPPAPRPAFTNVRDAQNPAAVAYANQRLAALRQQGYTPQMFGLHGDPTSLWRQMSPLVGAMRSGGSYLQQPRPNVNPQIGAVIAAQQSAYNNPDAPDAISPMSGGVASDPAQMSNVYGRVVPPPLAAGAAGVIGHPFDTSRLAPFHPNHQLPQLVIPARTRSRMHSNYNDLKTRFLRSVAQNRGRGGRILAG